MENGTEESGVSQKEARERAGTERILAEAPLYTLTEKGRDLARLRAIDVIG